jgi:hypothetical protein
MSNWVKTPIALVMRAETKEDTLFAVEGEFMWKIRPQKRIGSSPKDTKQ